MNRKQWINVVFCTVLMLLLGFYYTWSVFGNALIENYGWTYTAANLPYTLTDIGYSAGIFGFGFFYTRFGPKKTITLSGILMGMGFLGSAYFFTEGGVAVCYGIIVGAAMAGSYTSALSTMMKWAPSERRSLYTGVATGASGLAGVFTSFLLNALIGNFGTRNAFAAAGLLHMPLILLTAVFISLPGKTGEEDRGRAPELAEGVTFREALRSRAFYLLILMYILGTGGGSTVISNMSSIALNQCGLKSGYLFVSFVAVCNFAGRIMGGYLGDLIPRKKLLIGALAMEGIALGLFGLIRTTPALILGVIAVVTAYGCHVALTPVFVMEYFGFAHYSEIYGAVVGLSFCAGFLGPQLAGRIVDRFGSFGPAYLICALYELITIGLVLLLPKSRKKQ